MADESSKIPEKTVEQIFDERYPLDKWKDSNYSILDKFSMRGRKGFVTGAAGGLGRNAAAALAQAGADVALLQEHDSDHDLQPWLAVPGEHRTG